MLTSFETTPTYYERVAATRCAPGLGNVDYRLIRTTSRATTDEQGDAPQRHFVRAAHAFGGRDAGHALVELARRAALHSARGVAPKIKRGGLLDSRQRELVSPAAAGRASARAGIGLRRPWACRAAGDRSHECWPAFARLAAGLGRALVVERRPDDADPGEAVNAVLADVLSTRQRGRAATAPSIPLHSEISVARGVCAAQQSHPGDRGRR